MPAIDSVIWLSILSISEKIYSGKLCCVVPSDGLVPVQDVYLDPDSYSFCVSVCVVLVGSTVIIAGHLDCSGVDVALL